MLYIGTTTFVSVSRFLNKKATDCYIYIDFWLLSCANHSLSLDEEDAADTYTHSAAKCPPQMHTSPCLYTNTSSATSFSILKNEQDCCTDVL